MRTENPIRIVRSSKPKVCKNCKSNQFQKVLYGIPDDKTWNDKNFDCRGCWLPTFVKIKTSEGTFFFPEPKYSCSKCGLEVYMKSERMEGMPIDDSTYFFAEEWQSQDQAFINLEIAKMKNKVQERDSVEVIESFESDAVQTNTFQQLKKLKEKYKV